MPCISPLGCPYPLSSGCCSPLSCRAFRSCCAEACLVSNGGGWRQSVVCSSCWHCPRMSAASRYYVFRGNHWDHFGYINQSLTILSHPFATYENAAPAQFLATDVLAARPAVGRHATRGGSGVCVDAARQGRQPASTGVSLRHRAHEPDFSGGLLRLEPAFSRATAGRIAASAWRWVLSAAYVVGFWGQYAVRHQRVVAHVGGRRCCWDSCSPTHGCCSA